MPLIMCYECLKKHVNKPDDQFYNVYCIHEYNKLKEKYIQEKNKKNPNNKKTPPIK